MPTGNEEEHFDHDDIKDLDITFAKIQQDSETNLVVEFHISKLSARDMIDEWYNALAGNKKAIRACMDNYGYICENILSEITFPN